MSHLPQWHDLPKLVGIECKAVLDIGCGDGETLALCPHVPFRAGIDISPQAIALAQQRVSDGDFRISAGESLPFETDRFDAVVTCVALPYMNIPVVLKECARVLKPAGKLFLSVHDWEFIQLRWKSVTPNLAGKVFRVYVTLNGLCFHYFGKLFRYPLRPSMMESFQTETALRRSLRAAGFNHVTRLDREITSYSAVLE